MRLLYVRFEGVSSLKKKRNRCGEEIDACVILIRLSIGHRKSENGQPNCIYSYPECALEYTGHLASRNILVEIWKDAYNVLFANFWSSVANCTKSQ